MELPYFHTLYKDLTGSCALKTVTVIILNYWAVSKLLMSRHNVHSKWLYEIYNSNKFDLQQCLKDLSDWTEHFGIYLHKNQQMHQNYHFIVMLSQTLLHVSAYQRHHHKAHMILTSNLYVSVHYRKNKGISCEIAPISIVKLCIEVDVVIHCLWGSYELRDDGVGMPKHAGAFD
jgi:hypothetical protein